MIQLQPVNPSIAAVPLGPGVTLSDPPPWRKQVWTRKAAGKCGEAGIAGIGREGLTFIELLSRG